MMKGHVDGLSGPDNPPVLVFGFIIMVFLIVAISFSQFLHNNDPTVQVSTMSNTGILTVLPDLGFLLWYDFTFLMLYGFGGVIVYLRMPWLVKEAGYE